MLYAIIGILVIIADQWVKWWVSAGGTGETGFSLIPGVLSMVNVHNDGAAFSFLAGSNARIYFIALTGIFTLLVIIALATKFISGPVSRWSIVLVTAGGLSNCIDRIINGYVQDMFKFDIPALDWFPVFNVADVFITVFALLFILAVIFGKTKRDEDDYDLEDEFEDVEEEEPVRPSARERRAERKAERKAERRREKYEEEAAVIEEPKPARRRVPPVPPQSETKRSEADPFAEWDRAVAETKKPARTQPEPAAPAPQPKPAARPAAKPAAAPVQPSAPAAPKPESKPASESFDLEDILAEFK